MEKDIESYSKNSGHPLHIYQIYYDKTQVAQLDPAFIPFNNEGAQFPYNYEFGVIIKSFEKNFQPKELRGHVSWKFSQKTGIDGKEFIQFINDNPGYDVYFINPYPTSLFYQSVWHQGELFHSGLIKFTQSIFDKLKINIDLSKQNDTTDKVLYCNFWVGNEKFWNEFIGFSKPVWDYLETHATEEEKKFYQSKGDKSGSPYSPYIFERFFTTFLSQNKSITYKYYTYDFSKLKQKYNIVLALLFSFIFLKVNSKYLRQIQKWINLLLKYLVNYHFKKTKH